LDFNGLAISLGFWMSPQTPVINTLFIKL
jgi:hypothetical protein